MPKEILVWDRYYLMLTLLDTFLKEAGYNVSPAVTKEEATKILQSKSIDAIILDCYPGMKWEETVRKLKALPGASDETPFLFLTTSSDQTDLARLQSLGRVLKKPFDVVDLFTEVREMLGEEKS